MLFTWLWYLGEGWTYDRCKFSQKTPADEQMNEVKVRYPRTSRTRSTRRGIVYYYCMCLVPTGGGGNLTTDDVMPYHRLMMTLLMPYLLVNTQQTIVQYEWSQIIVQYEWCPRSKNGVTDLLYVCMYVTTGTSRTQQVARYIRSLDYLCLGTE